MNKKIYFKLSLLTIGFFSLMMTSCSDWLDVNSNPYVANDQANIDPGYLFNYAATTHSSNRQSGDFYIPLLISAQTVADGGFGDYGGGWDEAKYDISIYSTGNTWVTAYANVGTNLSKAKDFARANEDVNAIAQANILQAQTFFETSMLFGDVPFSEALNIDEYKTPKFDAQKDVLQGILDILDDALSSIITSDPGIAEYDIFYKGNMEKWAKLAKSLKLRVLLLMVDKEPSKAAEIKTLVEQGGFIDDNSEWLFPFFDVAGTQNPQFRINDMYASSDPGDEYFMFFAHNSVLDLMLPFNDPRLPVYFYKGTDDNYHGLLTSQDAEIDDDDEYLSSGIKFDEVWKSTTPDVLYSFSELSFMLSEIYSRGIGVAKDQSKANEHYLAGVRSNMEYFNVSDDDIDDYVAQLADLSTLTDDKVLEAIYSQVWISMMTRPFEAWVNFRRTDFPVLSVPADAPYPSLINRWVYPDRERNVNPNVPSPLPEITDKMWFQK